MTNALSSLRRQTFFRNELTSNAVDAVGLVLDADKSGFQTLDEFLLAGCQLNQLLFALRSTTLFKYLVSR